MSQDEVARLRDAAVNVPFPPLPEPPLVSERLAREVRLNVEAYRDALLRAALSGVPEGAASPTRQPYTEADFYAGYIEPVPSPEPLDVLAALHEIAHAADAFVDELDPDADADPLSDHYRSQAEARLRTALDGWRVALAAPQPVPEEPTDG